ncbi:hypothetical protein FRC06_006041 [Ceratobasidium sp. 370]|nr:hypothetical protein FRC06_006041 [Ceratobasidium sp. 370]
MGARVVLACRSESRAREAKRRLVADTGSEMVEVEILNCSSFDSVRAFVDRWGNRESKRVDIIIDNAGCLNGSIILTKDELEQSYQANHLSHMLLTILLLNRGYMTSAAHIVAVSSVLSYTSDQLDQHNFNGSDILARYHSKHGVPLEFKDTV